MAPSIRFFSSTLLGLLLSLEVIAAPITIGPYTFSGEEAFPTDAEYVSGDPTYIRHPDGGLWEMVAGNTTTDLDSALTGHDVTFGVGGTGIIVDLTFGMASVFNGTGVDLVVFETAFVENFEISAFVGSTLTTRKLYWSAALGGVSVGGVAGIKNSSALNAVAIDLSELGLLDGEAITGLRVYSQPFGVDPEDETAGADIVVVGALNFRPVGVPEPTALSLMGLGLAGIGYRWHRFNKVA